MNFNNNQLLSFPEYKYVKTFIDWIEDDFLEKFDDQLISELFSLFLPI